MNANSDEYDGPRNDSDSQADRSQLSTPFEASLPNARFLRPEA
jgi:hypothetical protein